MQGVPIERVTVDVSPSAAPDDALNEAKQNYADVCSVFDDLDLLRPVIPDNGDAPCLGEVLYFMFEWMARNKATDAASKSAWAMLAEVLPEQSFPRHFSYAKTIIDEYMAGKVKEIPICPKGHIAYYDCTSPELKHCKHASKTACPICGLSKEITVATRHGPRTIPRAKMYYLSVERYFRDMFHQPDLAVQLDYTRGERLPGDLKSSRGFHQKVSSNPVLNTEGRNQAVIATADGVPLFKDMTARKGHPFMLRPANASESNQKDLFKAHLFGYVPCEHWEIGPTGHAMRVVRSPPSFQPMMYVFADEMDHLYRTGAFIEDFSRDVRDPNRCFLMRVMLLFWIGDYPGLGEICDFQYVRVVCMYIRMCIMHERIPNIG